MLAPVVVPTVPIIEAWSSINELPIVETAPRTVPLSIMISPSTESDYRKLRAFQAGLPASGDERAIREMQDNATRLDLFIRKFYPKRSIYRPISEYMEKIKKERGDTKTPQEFTTPEMQQVAKQILDEQIGDLQQIRADAEDIANSIGRNFGDNKFWQEGHYSEVFLESFCATIYKVMGLTNLIPVKPSLIDDMSGFLKLINNPSFTTEIMNIRMWAMNENAIFLMILKRLETIENKQTILIFDVLYDYIWKQLIGERYTHNEQHYSYIATLAFITNFYYQQYQLERVAKSKEKRPKYELKPLSDDIKYFINSVCEAHLSLPIIFEICMDIKQFFNADIFKIDKKKVSSEAQKITLPNLGKYLEISRQDFRRLSSIVTELIATSENISMNTAKTLCDVLPTVLRNVSMIIGQLGETLADRRLRGCPKEAIPADCPNKDIFQYEWAMKNGLYDVLGLFLMLMNVCRTTKELLVENIDIIIRAIQQYTQHYVQNFVVNIIPNIVLRYSQKEIKTPLMGIRALLGYFKDQKDFEVDKKRDKKDQKLKYPSSGPAIDFLELARVQCQIMTTADSPLRKKQGVFKGAVLDKDDVEVLMKFADDTRYFADILRLPEKMDSVFDQSRFFFKEQLLDKCKTNFFKVSSSLPMVLSDFALANYRSSELTSAIFYPLSIYDDAAKTALSYLECRFLYNEIKAEASICLESIMRLIAENSFDPIHRFIMMRSLKNSMVEDITKKHGNIASSESSSAVRLSVLLQQNQLFVLGCPIDTKSLIAHRTNELFHERARNIIDLTIKHGVLVGIAVRMLIDVLKQTHELLSSFGLPLIPFNDIMAHVLYHDTPNSLQTRLLHNMAGYLAGPMLQDTFYQSNPSRLVPKSQPVIDFRSLFTGRDVDIIEVVLRPTVTFISVESFKEIFHFMDVGTISILHMTLLQQMEEIFEEFVAIYSRIRGMFTRIKDAPLSSSSAQVFDRFDGAYRAFISNSDIDQLFQVMNELGTIVAASEMMDDAFALKKSCSEQTIAYLTSRKPTDPDPSHPELFDLFDAPFKESERFFDSLKSVSKDNENLQPFQFAAVSELARLISTNQAVFEETGNLLNTQSMNGFAAVWSILDFLYDRYESICSEQGKPGSICSYGEGVQNFAAVTLLVTGQMPLYRVLSIGDRIAFHVSSDFTQSINDHIQRFLAVHRLTSTTLMNAAVSLEPCVNKVKSG